MNDCGCCDGLTAATPVAVDNRPGLSAIAYRAGTHAQFKTTALARLSTSHLPALAALTTRQDDDFTIALLDAWAAVCDVLTFYQERLANEQYLRTSTELLSAVELARLIGYQLQPGVAASVDLAFTVEEAPGALGQTLGVGTTAQITPAPPLRAVVDVGTKVQSIAGPGEDAQTFETVAKIEARPEWNALRPRMTQPQLVSTAADSVFIQGTGTSLKPGDTLLVAQSATKRAVRHIRSVVTDDQAKVTRVDFAAAPDIPAFDPPQDLPKGNVDDIAADTPLNGSTVATTILAKSWSEEDLSAAIAIAQWDPLQLKLNIAKQIAPPTEVAATPVLGVFALRQRAAIFGHNAPRWESLSANLRFGEWVTDASGHLRAVLPAFPDTWEGRTLEDDSGKSSSGFVFLDNVYPGIGPDTWIALRGPAVRTRLVEKVPGVIERAEPRIAVRALSASSGSGKASTRVGERVEAPDILVRQPAGSSRRLTQVAQVTDNIEVTRSDFAISAKVSRLTVQFVAPLDTDMTDFRMRTTTVLGQSEPLLLADLPIIDPIKGDSVELDGLYLGLKPGQRAIVTGEHRLMKGVIASEAATLKAVTIEAGFTVLTFEKALTHHYVRDSVRINANVAPATQGESVEEVLGSGNGIAAFQQFALRQPPLTYVSAAVPSGAISTLTIRVDGLLWHEAPSFFGHGPDERIYVTSTDDQGRTTVTFGDGRAGARLPTGQENVRAKYRKGIGAAANLGADRLTQMLTRPLGVKAATNPLPASGGADREAVADVRRNAPIAVLTLGRIVSLRDYEDLARAFAGIAKSLATWTWNGTVRGVFVTVAGAGGARVKKGTPLYKHLVKAIHDAGDPTIPFQVSSYTQRFFRLSAGLQLDPDFLPDEVTAAVAAALRQRFSFDERRFGQPVTRSEVTTVIQNVRGVIAVDLNELYRTGSSAVLNEILPADVPAPGATTLFGAELLTLDAHPIDLEVLP
jgi:hypothetical protein